MDLVVYLDKVDTVRARGSRTTPP